MNPSELLTSLKRIENNRNIRKPQEMTKIPLKPKNMQNTLETSENDKYTIKPSRNTLDFFRFWGYFGRFQIVLLIWAVSSCIF